MTLKPGKYNPLKPDIELFDYKSKKRYGLKLDGSGALQVGTISQDDTVHISSAGKRLGDFDEQRSWTGGRGIEDLSANAAGYWDSQNAWTMTDGHVHQTLLWQTSIGFKITHPYLPSKTRSMNWKQLLGTSKYLTVKLTPGMTFNPDYLRLWVRRIGNPGTLTMELCDSSANVPSTVLKTVTVTTSNITDIISVFQMFDWSGTQTLTVSTDYFVKVYGASTDNKTNHWEIGGYVGGTNGLLSSDGSSWSAASFDLYHYLSEADTNRTFFSFVLDEAMYVVDKKDDGTTASRLWINGDRGKATSGASTSLTDTAKAWDNSKWVDAYVKIIRGTGAGQVRQITANSGSALTVATWATNPDSTSEYIIYATQYFTEIASAGLAVVSGQPVVANQVVYFPQNTTVIRKMIWNSTTAAHSFNADANTASLLQVKNDTGGLKIWGASSTATNSSSVMYATAPAYNTTPTGLTFSSAINVGDTTYKITNMIEKDSYLYVFKTDGVYTVSLSGTTTLTAVVIKLQSGLDKTPSITNGAAAISHQQFIFYSWLYSAIRIYGSSHDDVGQDWRGWGLPDGREGNFSSFDAYTSLLIGAIDAGTGTSSILGFDGIGWHELLRAYDSNKRIRFVKIQVCEETRNRMWIDIGGDLIYQEMPLKKGSPRLDFGVRYMHEAVIESATIDMGTASGLPKFIKELTVSCNNLGTSNEIRVDYQVDDDVHTNRWTEATTLFQSPESTAFLGLSNVRKFCYRLRILSADNTLPVDVVGVVPNGYARVPYKMVWTLRCRADNISSRGRLVKPDEMMRWLLDNARFPGRIEMQSQYELAHKFFVIVHPPRMFPYKPAQNGQAEESVFTLVLEEA
jgi:hypothetical protein